VTGVGVIDFGHSFCLTGDPVAKNQIHAKSTLWVLGGDCV